MDFTTELNALKAEVKRLESLLKTQEKEEKGEKRKTFMITFKYQSYPDLWGNYDLSEASVRRQIVNKLDLVSDSLDFQGSREAFEIVSVIEVEK